MDIRTDERADGLWRRVAARYAERGADWTPRALKRAWFDAVARAEAALGGPWPEIDILPVFAGLYAERGAAADDATVCETARLFREASLRRLRLYAGAAALLDALRAGGRRVVLLSNAQRAFTLPELERLDLLRRFDGVYLSSDYGCRKPDPRFFRAMLDGEGLDPARCLMIGNDPACDAGGALNVGMDALYIRCALSPSPEPPVPQGVMVQDGMDLVRVRRRLIQHWRGMGK